MAASTDDPLADLAESIAGALQVFVQRRRGLAPAGLVSPQAPAVVDAPLPRARGPRQQEAVTVLLAAPDGGMKTGDIARAIGMEQPNAYLTLRSLVEQDIVELVPHSDPQRWRLLARYRQRQQILDAGTLVEEGEFTTYGDISQVVYGHARGGQAVGRVVTTPDFAHPHRVLNKGGAVPTTWSGENAPEDLRDAVARLRGEGIEILTGDAGTFYAHPRHYVAWEDLEARLNGPSS